MIGEIRKYIYEKLTTDSTIKNIVGNRVYRYRVPSTAKYPCILFAYYGKIDPGFNNTARVLESRTPGALLFIIRGVSVDGDTNAEPLERAIETCLVGIVDAVTTNWTISNIRLAEPLETAEYENEKEFLYSGGIYRFDLKNN